MPVDNKHRGSWLMTLNSARSWQMTSVNSAKDNFSTHPVKLQKHIAYESCGGQRAYLEHARVKDDCSAHGRSLHKPSANEQDSIIRCSQCRRSAYALACVGAATILTRYQEWTLPFLTLLGRAVCLQNEHLSSVLLRAGRYLQNFLVPVDVDNFRRTCRFAPRVNPNSSDICACPVVTNEMPRSVPTVTCAHHGIQSRQRFCMKVLRKRRQKYSKKTYGVKPKQNARPSLLACLLSSRNLRCVPAQSLKKVACMSQQVLPIQLQVW